VDSRHCYSNILVDTYAAVAGVPQIEHLAHEVLGGTLDEAVVDGDVCALHRHQHLARGVCRHDVQPPVTETTHAAFQVNLTHLSILQPGFVILQLT
jgi:hypothetical protein